LRRSGNHADGSRRGIVVAATDAANHGTRVTGLDLLVLDALR